MLLFLCQHSKLANPAICVRLESSLSFVFWIVCVFWFEFVISNFSSNMSQHTGHSKLAKPAISLFSCLLNCRCLLVCNCLFRIIFVFVTKQHSQLANPAICVKMESGRTTLGEPWNTSRPGSRLLKNLFFSLSDCFQQRMLRADLSIGMVGLGFHFTEHSGQPTLPNHFVTTLLFRNFDLQVLVLAVLKGWSSSAISHYSQIFHLLTVPRSNHIPPCTAIL